jgi:hypothetical protein
VRIVEAAGSDSDFKKAKQGCEGEDMARKAASSHAGFMVPGRRDQHSSFKYCSIGQLYTFHILLRQPPTHDVVDKAPRSEESSSFIVY